MKVTDNVKQAGIIGLGLVGLAVAGRYGWSFTKWGASNGWPILKQAPGWIWHPTLATEKTLGHLQKFYDISARHVTPLCTDTFSLFSEYAPTLTEKGCQVWNFAKDYLPSKENPALAAAASATVVAGLLPRIDIKSEEKGYIKEFSFSNTHRIAHAVIIALSTIILAPAFNKHFSDQWMGKLQALAWGGLSGGLYYLVPNSNTYDQWDKLDSHKGKKILINDSYKKRFLAYSLMAGLAVYGTWKQITTKPLFGNFAVAALLSGLTYTAMTPLNKKMLKWADPRLSEHKCKIFLKHLPITLLPMLVAALFTRPLSRYFFSHKVSLSQLIGFIASSLFSIAATKCWIYNTENKDDANFLASIQLSSYDWGWCEGGLSIAAQVIVFVGSLIIFSAGKAVLKLAKENPSLYPMVPVGLSMAGSYLAGKTLGDLKSNDTGLVVGAIIALVAGILVSPLLPSKSLSHRVSFKQSAGFTAVGLLPLLFAIKFIKEETADYELLG